MTFLGRRKLRLIVNKTVISVSRLSQIWKFPIRDNNLWVLSG